MCVACGCAAGCSQLIEVPSRAWPKCVTREVGGRWSIALPREVTVMRATTNFELEEAVCLEGLRHWVDAEHLVKFGADELEVRTGGGPLIVFGLGAVTVAMSEFVSLWCGR